MSNCCALFLVKSVSPPPHKASRPLFKTDRQQSFEIRGTRRFEATLHVSGNTHLELAGSKLAPEVGPTGGIRIAASRERDGGNEASENW